MGASRVPDPYSNPVREEGGSLVLTIPVGAVDEVEIEPGEEPEVECDPDTREVSLRFGG